MKKLLFVLISLGCLICLGCDYNQIKISDKIYETFFENIVEISIMTTDNDLYSRDNNEIDIIKAGMRDIKITKKYTRVLNYGQVFINQNFRLLLITTKINDKKYQVLQALYSTRDSNMVIREGDIFSDRRPKKMGEKIFVYELKIPQKVNNILKKYENNLSMDGSFLYTWANPELFLSKSSSK